MNIKNKLGFPIFALSISLVPNISLGMLPGGTPANSYGRSSSSSTSKVIYTGTRIAPRISLKSSTARIAPRVSFFSPKKLFNRVVDFFDRKTRQDLIGLTSQQYKEALENQQDIDQLVMDRAQHLCQLKGYKNVSGQPIVEKKMGRVYAVDMDKNHLAGELMVYDEIAQGPRYFKQNMEGKEIEITQSEYAQRIEKGGRWVNASSIKEGDMPTLVIKDLKCSGVRSLDDEPDFQAVPVKAKSTLHPSTSVTEKEDTTTVKIAEIRKQIEDLQHLLDTLVQQQTKVLASARISTRSHASKARALPILAEDSDGLADDEGETTQTSRAGAARSGLRHFKRE